MLAFAVGEETAPIGMTTHLKGESPMNNTSPSATTVVVRIAKTALLRAAVAFVLLGFCRMPAVAQQQHSHATSHQTLTAAQQSKADDLVKIVREATERFNDVSVAEAEGYRLQFGCVSGDSDGAMGLHFINGDLVASGVIDASRPPIVIYEPTPSGRLRLIGADFLVFQSAWDAKKQGPPELMGQLFHLFDAPNRFGLPAFYTLHVWAWKENPNGAFVNWHPDVSCQSFTGQNP